LYFISRVLLFRATRQYAVITNFARAGSVSITGITNIMGGDEAGKSYDAGFRKVENLKT
jgi:hypothetical protein